VDYVAVWSAATELLNDEIVSQQKRAYLRLTHLRAIVDDTALLAVPDAFTRDVIESQLRTAITEALSRHLGRPVQVAVTVRPPEDGARNALTAPTAAIAVVPVPQARAQTTRAQPPRQHVPASREPQPDDALFQPNVEDSAPESGPGRVMSDS
jgi:chromosomal replication initiator protein